jgi:hypothetical protein
MNKHRSLPKDENNPPRKSIVAMYVREGNVQAEFMEKETYQFLI